MPISGGGGDDIDEKKRITELCTVTAIFKNI
jgi:hypothetical protein